MKKLIKLSCLIAIYGQGMAIAQDRDPFAPYVNSAPVAAVTGSNGGKADANELSPLTEKPITAYSVIGVVVSPNDALAVLKSRDKHEYFAYIGDKLGSEGGILETINSEGITVNIHDRIVPLKVSNRFEMQDDKQTDENK